MSKGYLTPTDLRYSSLKGTKTAIECHDPQEFEEIKMIIGIMDNWQFNPIFPFIPLDCENKVRCTKDSFLIIESTIIPASDFIASNTADNGKGEMASHETFVIGFNKDGEVIFFKSYQYTKQKEEAQSDLKWVIDNCHHWEIGAATEWKLTHEGILHDIVIPHP